MTEKRCTDCKHTKGIGYDFWCGEGHTEYEVFGAETNCPYYEYHDWSKDTPSRTEKQLYEVINKEEPRGQSVTYKDIPCTTRTCVTRLNKLTEENEQLQKRIMILQDKLKGLMK